jgi:hypothetical protein
LLQFWKLFARTALAALQRVFIIDSFVRHDHGGSAAFAYERPVLWAWSPGVNRTGASRSPSPSHDQFMTVVRGWISSAAVCPQ